MKAFTGKVRILAAGVFCLLGLTLAKAAGIELSQDTGASRYDATVVRVDVGDQILSVKDKQGNKTTIRINGNTRIKREGKAVPLSDIDQGEPVIYELDPVSNHPTARMILLTGNRTAAR